MDAITSFSYKPLRMSFALASITTFISLVLAVSMLIPSSPVAVVGLGVAAAVFFVGSMLLVCLGVLGEYVGRVYDEVRSRPLSIISKVYATPTRAMLPVGMIAVPGGYHEAEVTEAA